MADILTPDPREERLPRWAAARMRSLRAAVQSARAETPTDGASLVVNPYADVPVGFSEDAHARFFLGPEHHAYIEADLVRDTRRGTGVAVRGSAPLVIHPAAANVVEVYVEDFFRG